PPKGSIGWMDTYMPGVVWVPVGLVLAALVSAGIGSMTRWRAVAWSGLVAVTCGVPLWVLQRSGTTVGGNIQARYLLPLVFAVVVLAIVAPKGPVGWQVRPLQVVASAVALSVANAAALHVNLRRYVTGTDVA